MAVPSVAAAAPDAGEHFKRGVQLYKEYDYAGALVEFQRAYDVDPKYQVLFNIAESHYQLQDYANALKAFQRYLDDGGTQIPAKRRKDVEAEIATLSKRIATLTIQTSEPGATVTIDDRAVGTSPLEPIVVSSGRRKISATLPGRAPATTTVDLAGGDKKTIALEIPPAPGAGGPPAGTSPPPDEEEPSPIPMVVMWSVTGAVAVGAVITGSLALGASSDVEEELGRFPGNADSLASASDSASTLGLVTDILIGTAVVSAGVATYFTVDYVFASEDGAAEEEAVPASDEEAARNRRAHAPPTGTARVVVSPRGLAFAGTF